MNQNLENIAGAHGQKILQAGESYTGKIRSIVPNETPANLEDVQDSSGSSVMGDLNITNTTPLNIGPLNPIQTQKTDHGFYFSYVEVASNGGSVVIYLDENDAP